jgi:hypothetical protein
MEFKDIIGKTIKNIQQLKEKKYDDEGYLLIEFTDGSKVLIIGGYNPGYTGNSSDEYQTTISIEEGNDLASLESL